MLHEQIVRHGEVASHVRIHGQGEGGVITILPSLGRGVEDYTGEYRCTLTERLVEAGYRVVLIQPRGIGASEGDLTPGSVSMQALAGDIAAVLDALDIDRLTVIGHAFGNRLARTFATLYPRRVDHLVLLAAGGNFPMSDEQKQVLRDSVDLSLPDEQRLRAIERAFFAAGNDPSVWLHGWYPQLMRAQSRAVAGIDGEFFKRAGGKPFLLVQPAEDFIAPPDKAGKALRAELGEQVTYVEIAGTGHALTSERPDQVARHVLAYLRR